MRSGLNLFARLALTATAIAPVGLIYAVVSVLQMQITTAIAFLVGTCIAVLVCVGILGTIKGRSGVKSSSSAPEKHRITSIEPADRENTAIILLYLMPLFTKDVVDLNWEIWIPRLLVFISIGMTSHIYFFNPLLSILGWHFYRMNTPENVTRILISKKTINNCDGTIIGIQLSDYTVLHTE